MRESNEDAKIDPFIGQPVYGAFSLVLAFVFPVMWCFLLRSSVKFSGLGYKIAAYGQLISHGIVGLFWLLSVIFSIRQIYEWFMIVVRFSVLFNWTSQIYAMIYLLVRNVDWTDYETIMPAIGLIAYVSLTFVWQVYLCPPTLAWYRLAKEAVNYKYYPQNASNDI